jgi:hypothetical protein
MANLVVQGVDPAKRPQWLAFTPPGRDTMTGQSRTRLVAGDPLRGFLVFWDRMGRLPPRPGEWWGQPDYLLVGPNGLRMPLARVDPGNASRDTREYDARYYGEVRLPGGLPAGDYTLVAGAVPFYFSVYALPPRWGFAPVTPATPLPAVQDLLDNAYDLDLGPGYYPWARNVYDAANPPLRLSAGTTVRGSGAVVTAPAMPPPAAGDEWVWCPFVAADGCVLDGLEVRLMPGMRVVQAMAGATNLTLSRCRLAPAALNEPGPGLAVQDCEVTGVGAGIWTTTGGLFRRIYAYRNADSHVLSCWSADGTLAVIDFHWDWTDRGFVAQPNWGDVRANLFLGPWCSNVCFGENGCECFLAEVSPDFGFHDNLIFHYRYEGGPGGGSAVQWDDKARNNYVREAKVYGGRLMLAGAGVGDNVVEDLELAGGLIHLGPGANNAVVNSAVCQPRAGSGGLQYVNPVPYNEWTQAVRWEGAVGPGNLLTNVVFDLGLRFTPVLDPGRLTITGCWWNGAPFPGG